MSVGIATWNTRGNPANNPAKLDVLNAILLRSNIVLLQECGNLQANQLGEGYYFYRYAQAGAFNNRCTLGIISDQELANVDYITLPSSNGRACYYGLYDGLIVGTLHSNAAGNAGFDGTAAITALTNAVGRDTSVIIGGDFNTEPFDFSKKSSKFTHNTRSKRIGSFDRGESFSIAAPASYTHIGGRTYDYFVHSRDVYTRNIQTWFRYGGSDHKPVMLDAGFYLRGG